jgi:hypothetical protein
MRGAEHVNAQVDALIHTGVLRRLLAVTELTVSNSMIEAWWRSSSIRRARATSIVLLNRSAGALRTA